MKSLRLLAVGVLASALSVLLSPAGPAGAQNVRLCGGMPVTILGTDGDDVLGGTDGPDVIAGLQGNDVLLGFGGDDIICGGLGNDIVAGGPGFDILEGSQGNDVLWANGQSINNANKIEDTRGARMFGGAGNDLIIGSNRWDRMQGGDGDDIFFAYEGRDWIRGGNGQDRIDAGAGIDDIFAGRGSDSVEVGASDLIRMGNDNQPDGCVATGERATQLWGCEVTITATDYIAEGSYRGHLNVAREQWVDVSQITFNVADQIVAGSDEIDKMGLLDTVLPEVRWRLAVHTHTGADKNTDLRTSQRRADTLTDALTNVGIDDQTPRGRAKLTVQGYGDQDDVIGPNGLYSQSLSNRVSISAVDQELFENWSLDLASCQLAFPTATSCS